MKELTFSDIEAMVREDESRVLEVKKTTGELNAGMCSGCAFLNTDGGWLLFGVTPALKIIGQDDPINDPINDPIKGLALEIYRIIKANPGIKKAAIAQKINRSEATVKRYAKQLSEAKLIEYKDSNKTGVYFVK